MLIYPQERCGLFFDGTDLSQTAKKLGFMIDFKNLLEYFRSQTRVITARYYSLFPVDESQYSRIKPFIDWLEYNGYTTVAAGYRKTSREIDEQFEVERKADVKFAVDALRMSDALDHVVLFTGDACFVPLVGALLAKGKRVTIVSSIRTNPPAASDELRRTVESFCDLEDLVVLADCKNVAVAALD